MKSIESNARLISDEEAKTTYVQHPQRPDEKITVAELIEMVAKDQLPPNKVLEGEPDKAP